MSLYWGNSQCSPGWLHDFQILRNDSEVAEEVCRKCHKRVYFKVRNGTINNYNYLKYHMRSALPKYHKRFEHEYNR